MYTLDGADEMEGDIDIVPVGFCDGTTLIDGTNDGETDGCVDGLDDGGGDSAMGNISMNGENDDSRLLKA